VVAQERFCQTPQSGRRVREISFEEALPIRPDAVSAHLEILYLPNDDRRRRLEQARHLIVEGRQRGGRRRDEEVRNVTVGAHQGVERGEVGLPQFAPRLLDPRKVQGVASRVEEHPEARHRFPQRTEGEAHLREVFRGESYREHSLFTSPLPRHRGPSR
jgi:hypothetical protein